MLQQVCIYPVVLSTSSQPSRPRDPLSNRFSQSIALPPSDNLTDQSLAKILQSRVRCSLHSTINIMILCEYVGSQEQKLQGQSFYL